MSRGKCAGCAIEDSSCKVVKNHTLTCPEFIELYRTDPARALDPEDEYRRHLEWLRSEEGQEAATERAVKTAAHNRETAERILQRDRERWGGKAVPVAPRE